MTTSEPRKHGPVWMAFGILSWTALAALIVFSAVARLWGPFTMGILIGAWALMLFTRNSDFGRRPAEFLLNTGAGRIVVAAIGVAGMALTVRDLHRLEWYLAVTIPLLAIWIAATWRFRWRS